MLKFTLRSLTLICLTVFISIPALAAPLPITTWNYKVEYDFADYWNESDTKVGLSYESVAEFGQPGSALYWGSTAQSSQSSLGFITKSGTVDTDGPTAVIDDHWYHRNFPIPASSELLQGGIISATLTLQALSPAISGGHPEDAYSASLDFLFYETDNWSSDTVNSDVFLLTNPEAASENFSYLGYNYTFDFSSSFTAIGDLPLTGMRYRSNNLLALLEGEYGDDMNSFVGWTTLEGTTTYQDSFLSISSQGQVVPEPSTFILLGAGLLGLVAVSRKRFVRLQ